MAKGKGRSPKVCCITGSGVDKGCLGYPENPVPLK